MAAPSASPAAANDDSSGPDRSTKIIALVAPMILLSVVACFVNLWEIDIATTRALPPLPESLGRPSTPELSRLASIESTLVCLGLLVAIALPARHRQRWWGKPGFRRAVIGSLIVLNLVSGVNYLYGRRGLHRGTFPHAHDTLHYLLGPKYYPELDYDDLYVCVRQAMPSGEKSKGKARDLRTYKLATADVIMARFDCAERFGEARWQEFRSDVAVHAEGRGWGFVGGSTRDHGYNGTPFHSTMAGALANQFSLTPTTLAQSTLMDTAMLCVLFGVGIWTLGVPGGLLFALFVMHNASDRMLIIGFSFFRYAWFFALAVGVLQLHGRRYGRAAVWLATSAMLNVFPVVFCAGGAIPLLYASWRARKLSAELVRYASIGLVTATLAVVVSSSHSRGIGNYEGFITTMQTHDVRGRMPGFGVGLKFLFADPGPPERKAKRTSGGQRRKQFKERQGLFYLISSLAIGATAWVCRRLSPADAAIAFGLVSFYCLLGTTAYYFACASLLAIPWVTRLHKPSGRAMLLLMFGANMLGLLAFANDYHRFYVFNTVVSSSLALSLVAMVAYLAWENGFMVGLADALKRSRRKMASFAAR